MTINQLFFELIRVAIGTQDTLSRPPSRNEWAELYAMAKKQSLVGICFAAVQKLTKNQEPKTKNLDEVQYLTWMGMAAKIQQRNEVVNRQCVELQERLARDGFRSCILKGQGVARLYQIRDERLGIRDLSMLRQSGDIDVWLDAPKERVIEYVMKLVPTNEFDQKHIHFNCYDETAVEAHWTPVRWISPKGKLLHSYFDSESERQFSNIADGHCVPTADVQLVHQLLHVYGHYGYEGVGMRQMMDLYFAQMAVRNNDDTSTGSAQADNANDDLLRVLTLFKKLGLMRFVGATQWVLKTVFAGSANDDDNDKWLLCTPDEQEGQKLLDEIMIGGNFGHHDECNHVEGESFFGRFLRRWGRKFRMFRFDPLGTILMPFSRIKLEIWMRKVRRQYGV